MKKHIIVLAGILCCVFAFCSTGQGINSISKSKINYELTIGSGGGFTGGYEGHFIDSLGIIYSWKGIAITDSNKILFGKLNDEQIELVNKLIDSSDILNLDYRHSGNIISFITIKNDSKEYKYSWVGVSPDDNVPPNLRKFDAEIKQIIKQSINN
ncbi:MAG: hypothetical protein NTX22_09750 [Ignavibacteriales bacterium]|nr:hypothetical protein [Ignavibacteriales bacterium]